MVAPNLDFFFNDSVILSHCKAFISFDDNIFCRCPFENQRELVVEDGEHTFLTEWQEFSVWNGVKCLVKQLIFSVFSHGKREQIRNCFFAYPHISWNFPCYIGGREIQKKCSDRILSVHLCWWSMSDSSDSFPMMSPMPSFNHIPSSSWGSCYCWGCSFQQCSEILPRDLDLGTG